jgi:hypothetical protein
MSYLGIFLKVTEGELREDQQNSHFVSKPKPSPELTEEKSKSNLVIS